MMFRNWNHFSRRPRVERPPGTPVVRMELRTQTPPRLPEHEYEESWVRDNTIEVEFPCETKNPLNNRESWPAVAHRSKEARTAAWAALREKRIDPLSLPVVVHMTRIAAGRGLDWRCGLNAALKPVRDGVADWLGVDDNHGLIEWEYDQESRKGVKGSGMAIRIRVTPVRCRP